MQEASQAPGAPLDHLSVLADAGRTLGESLEASEVCARLARFCVPRMAQVAIVDLLDGAELRRFGGVAAGAPLQKLLDELASYPLRPTHPVRVSIREQRVLLWERLPDETAAQVAHDARHRELLELLGFVSVLVVPLVSRGAAIGALSLARPQAGAFTAEDVRLLVEVGRLGGLAIDNARLFRDEQHARREAEQSAARTLSLATVANRLAPAMEAEDAAEVILHDGLVAMGAAGAAVLLLEEDGRHLTVLRAVGYDPRVLEGPLRRIPVETNVPVAHAAHAGEAVFLSSLEEWDRRFTLSAVAARAHGSWAALPLLSGERVIGSLGVSWKGTRAFPAEERDFLRALAAQCAQALQRGQLFAMERKARAEAEEAVRAREEFLSIASHELRTPLTPLKLQLALLRRLAPPEFVARVEGAEKQVDRLVKLVNHLLDVSRIGLKRLLLEFEEVDLAPLVRAQCERMRAELAAAGCALRVEVESMRARVDPLRIEQVLANLLSNAGKYGAGKPVAVRLWRDGAAARLGVTDGGIGVDPREQERIFGRFERAVSAQQFAGLGLGLYVSRQIADAHRGTLEVESAPGRGSTFTLSLPLE